jgi:hypothetical protein
LVTPRITNKLRGALGEIYYKEFCDQEGWAYTSLENIYESMNPEWTFTFKKGFDRIKITIPEKIREEVKMLIKPTNRSKTSPSFVFDFLACNVKKYREYSKVNSDVFFTWVESKTGHMIFSGSQIRTMSKIELPLAIFHIADVLDKPGDIKMIYDLKSGEEWLKEFVPIENELYELA